MNVENRFEILNNDELTGIDGGSLSLGAAILIGGGIVLVAGAAVSFFNGYSDAAGK